MLKYPTGGSTPSSPSGVFIGDEHADLVHVIQLTASISEFASNGIQALFIEAFYASSPPTSTDVESLGNYIRSRNFDHTTTENGKNELPICYEGLLQRCERANMPICGVDSQVPPDIANLKKGKAFKMIRWRTTTVNDDWQRAIQESCQANGWSKFALFGGKAHAAALSSRFGARLTTQIWDRTAKQYVDL